MGLPLDRRPAIFRAGRGAGARKWPKGAHKNERRPVHLRPRKINGGPPPTAGSDGSAE
jgi:hypothetical protein